MSDASAKSTKVATIQEMLRKEIVDGVWKEGGKLPGDAELAKRFDCSMGTVNRAVSLLAHDGFVVRRPRMGTRVLRGGAARIGLDAFAFIYPSKHHEGIWRTVRGFQDAAEQSGRRVVMLNAGSDFQKEGEYIARLPEFDVKGGVIYPLIGNDQEREAFLKVIADSPFPLVIADVSFPGMRRPAVVVDNFHAGYTMARHLLSSGCRRIGFFGNNALSLAVRDRCNGYLWALQEAGLPEVAERVFLEPSMHPDFSHPLDEPTHLAIQYLEQAGDIDGVVCLNDILAEGLVRAARKKGISIPGKLRITGVDGLSISQAMSPTLTTYGVPFETLGRVAFEMLGTLVEGKTVAGERKIRGELIPGQSA